MQRLLSLIALACLGACDRAGADTRGGGDRPTSGDRADRATSGDRAGAPDTGGNRGNRGNRGNDTTVHGSGTAATEARAVGPFATVSRSGSMTLEVTVGPAASVEVTADDNLLTLVRTEVQGDTLVVDSRGSISPRTPIVVRVTTPTLDALITNGSGDATLTGVSGDRLALTSSGSGSIDASVEVARLSARLSGSGGLRLRGRADDLGIDLSGSGTVHARDAACQAARIAITGSGSAELTVRDTLDAAITGSGSIDYWGAPGKVARTITGSGQLHGH